MQLRRLALQHFRNLSWAELVFSGGYTALVGGNGQGKTNVLEAIGLLTALRSFRQSDNRLLIAHGQPEAALRFELDHERLGTTSVTIRLRHDSKEVAVDGTPVARLGDFLGRFPAVVFSTQDNQLIRGSPAARRRWLDLVLAAMDAAYFDALQRYHRALAGRNRLLKDQRPDPAQLAAFEQPLAAAAAAVVQARVAGVAELSVRMRKAYGAVCAQAEVADLVYEADANEAGEAAWAALFASSRERDIQWRSTSRGPHRDDLDLTLDGRSSRDFGSEGQQRSLVLALRLAQLGHFRERSGVQPLVLADDVLGELDPERRRRFWSAIDAGAQVVATGTTVPEVATGDWQIVRVAAGALTPEAAP
jgi:DNA replication and repair protein RecF